MIVIATIDELLEKVDSKYTLVHLAARRAREINAYYHSLGEGLGRYTPPLVESSSNKPLSIALEEIAAEKIVAHEPGDAEEAAAGLLGDAEGGDVVDLVQALTGAPEDDADEEPEDQPIAGDAVEVSDIEVDPTALEEDTDPQADDES